MAELADIAEAAVGARRPAESARLLPRHGPRLGGRHRPVATRPRSTRFLADFDARIGLERLVMVHLNDSKSELGSRLDRHEHLGAGRIGVDRTAPPARAIRALAHVDLLPRDAGDGRGLRRGQRRAGLRHRRGTAAGRAAAGGDGGRVAAGRGRARGPPSSRRPRTDARPAGATSRCDRTARALLLVAVPARPAGRSPPLLRLPDLATRGTWDADQGHDMLVLRAFVRDGIVPLLGPPTSIGDVHHGALYYYLLSPAALADRRGFAARRGHGAHRRWPGSPRSS